MKFKLITLLLAFCMLLTACLPKATPEPTPVLTPTRAGPITVSIDGIEIKDKDGNLVVKDKAPFKVVVRGEVSNADRLNLYLVVSDNGVDYVQPGLGPWGARKIFSGSCYLGEVNKGINKEYRIFAVVTNRIYGEQERLDNATVLASSDEIVLYRTH